VSKTRINQSRAWKLLSGAALIIASGFAWAPSAHAAQVINLTTPVSGVVTNLCPGSEPVQLSGESHEVISLSDSGDIQRYSLNWQGVKGVGLDTGTTYKLNLDIEFSNPPSGRETTSHFHGVTTGPGPDNNDLFRADFHITVNPDGTVTAYFANFFESCTQ
jgi:hypothetical protein